MLGGRFLLKRVDSGSTFGSHSHYADQCVAAALLTHGVTVDACVAYSAIAEHVRRTTECGRTSLCPSMPHGLLTRVPQDVACRPLLADSSLRFSRGSWFGFLEVRGFEPVTLLREVYLLTTSPRGRARPLGEVVKR